MRKRAQALLSLAVLPVVMLALGYFSIAAASLVPGEYRPQTGFLSDGMEHALAYFFIAGLTTLLTTPRYSIWALVLTVAAFAGTMELLQIFVPHRMASLSDFFVSSTGAVAGVVTVRFFLTFRKIFATPILGGRSNRPA